MQLEPEQRLDKLQEFTKSSSQIETDDVSASATVLVATTRDVEGNRTVSSLYITTVSRNIHYLIIMRILHESYQRIFSMLLITL